MLMQKLYFLDFRWRPAGKSEDTVGIQRAYTCGVRMISLCKIYYPQKIRNSDIDRFDSKITSA